MTPMVRTRDHLVSDKERILRASSDTSSGSILPVARHGLRGRWPAPRVGSRSADGLRIVAPERRKSRGLRPEVAGAPTGLVRPLAREPLDAGVPAGRPVSLARAAPR